MQRASATDEEASARLLLSGSLFPLLKLLEISVFAIMTLEKPHLVPIFACLVTTKMQIWAAPLAWCEWMPSCGWRDTVNDGSCRSDDRPVAGNFVVCSCACVQHVSEFRECG